MTPYEIILKKRNGTCLTSVEIQYIIKEFTKGNIPPYQMSAFLMAVYFQGLNPKETISFTESILNSGETLNLSGLGKPIIDKHSTGGVGDKISLILAPLAASGGIVVPMISGRALGHTGGTLDKLESIAGFNTRLTINQFKQQLSSIGVCMIGQTKELAPADDKMYALRDVTATVESIPLISASIMGKKLAEGIDSLVLDVKVGNGAFTKSTQQATKLAKTMIAIGYKMDKKVIALITDMNQPLGYTIGNSLEVKESLDVLRGKGPSDVRNLSIALAGYMFKLGGRTNGENLARKLLDNGSAYKKFLEMVKAQGGNIQKLPEAKIKKPIPAPRSGYLIGIDTLELGLCSIQLGAGRITMESSIDHSVGIVIAHKIGDKIEKGEPLAILHINKSAKEIEIRIKKAFKIGPKKPKPLPLIYKVYGPK